MRKFILLYSFLFMAIFTSFGQNPNEVFILNIAPLTYVEPSKSATVGSVLGTLGRKLTLATIA